MQHRSAIISFVFLLVSLSACNENPSVGGADHTEGTSIAADSFAQRSYYAEGRRRSVRLVSSSEIELSDGERNVVGTYTREGKRIRAVVESFGSKQAQYFVETDDCLQSERGRLMYYTESALAVLENQRARERAEEEARKTALVAEEERARVAAQAAEARCKALLEASRVQTKTIKTFQGYFGDVVLTDVGIKLANAGMGQSGAWFGELGASTIREVDSRPFHPANQRIFQVEIVDLWDAQRWLRRSVLASEIDYRPDLAQNFKVRFGTRGEAESFSVAVAEARQEWRAKWHELVACR